VSPLAAELNELLARVGEVRMRAEREAPDRVRRFIVEGLNAAQGDLVNCLAMATSHRPPTPLILAMGRAERAGDIDEVERLAGQADYDARAQLISPPTFNTTPKEAS
jgi:hypothetical protein